MSIKNYLALSTRHVSVKTATVLDQWAAAAPEVRPITVASTHFGWFVATEASGCDENRNLPADLRGAMLFGHQHGCAYLLFDCDAGLVDGIPTFSW